MSGVVTQRRNGVTPMWMRRYDVSWFEVTFYGAVLCGLIAAVITPSRVASVIELDGFAAGHPELWLSIAIVVAAMAIGRGAVVWGPVRVSRAVMRWELCGPGDRRPPLLGALTGVCLAVTATVFAVTGLAIVLAPAAAVTLSLAGAGCAVGACVTSYLTQVTVDMQRHPRQSGGRSWRRRWSPEWLHRSTISPADGLVSAVSVAVSMMDPTWLDDARIVRWQRANTAAAGAAAARRAGLAVLRLDLRRLLRHPGSLAAWLVWVGVSITVAQAFVVHIGGWLPAVVGIYGAGCAVAGGLRQAANTPALRRSTGRSDRYLYTWLSVLPVTAVVLAALVSLPFWGMSAVQVAVVAVGASVGVVRSRTRPPLPYDAPVVTDPVTGSGWQPLLLLAMFRGPVAVIVTAVLAGLI